MVGSSGEPLVRYHVDPATGNPGICRASIKCPFGILPVAHRDTPAEVRALFEATMADYVFLPPLKKKR
jgi:hypothetical protein